MKQKMLFGNKLQQEIYQPWAKYYLDYNGLKKLLKENVILQNNWSEEDEQKFVGSLDENLEKVYNFQFEKYNELNTLLDKLTTSLNTTQKDNSFDLTKTLDKLDEILVLAQELDHFQRLNYTGFFKIVKKHDRLHSEFTVRPLLNVRLKNLPFHSEDYSPLLYKISTIFQFLRENYDINQSVKNLSSFNDRDNSDFQNFKFWIHPDNLMEVKTTLLRHLPVIIFNQAGGPNNDDDYDDEEDDEDENKTDPTINCIYFDNPNFEIYNSKLTKSEESSTLRLKWLGNLSKVTKVNMEKKNFDPNLENFNINEKIVIKKKNVNSLIHNDMSFVKRKNEETEVFKKFGSFIEDHHLQPVLRTTYKRTAFQIPGDDKVRVTIDSNLVFIREDSFDQQRPIRDPSNWHREDIDSNPNYEKFLRTGEFTKFPYSVMEIRIKKFSSKRKIVWIEDLINSHLVKEIPNFSKFIHGISSLFLEDDHLDNIPFWYNELEQDIKVDPTQYFKQQEPQIQNDEENLSNFKKLINNQNNLNLRKSFSGSLLLGNEEEFNRLSRNKVVIEAIDEDESDDDDLDDDLVTSDDLPSPSSGGSIKNKLDIDSEDDEIELPPGVVKPESYIKNQGPLKIEPKVWLANERTFNRWLHVTTLLSTLTFIIYSSADRANSYSVSAYLAYIYFGLTLFSGVWAYYIFQTRREIIMERDSKHLDNMVGPLIVAGGLIFALIFNFITGFKAAYSTNLGTGFYETYPGHESIHKFIANLI